MKRLQSFTTSRTRSLRQQNEFRRSARRRCRHDMKRLLEVNTCPDFIEDKGHYYGHDLSDEDKRALIEYIKYF